MFGLPKSSAHVGRGAVSHPKDELWTPALLGSAVLAWWDVLDMNHIDQEGQGISYIADKTGNTHNLTQDTHAAQPLWVEHEFGDSFEGAVFDGVNDVLSTALALAQPFTVVQLIRTGDALEPFASSFRGGSTTDALVYLRNEDLSNTVALGSSTNQVSTGKVLDLQSTYILVSRFDDASSEVSINGEVHLTPGIGTGGVSGDLRV